MGRVNPNRRNIHVWSPQQTQGQSKDMARMNRKFSPEIFNIAQDFHINSQLDHAGYPVDQMALNQGHFTVDSLVAALSAMYAGEDLKDHKGGMMYDPAVRVDTTTESLYNEIVEALPDPPPDDGGGAGQGQGKIGGMATPDVGDGAGQDVVMEAFDETCKEEGLTPEQAGQEMQSEIMSAAEAASARDPGSVPGHIKDMLEEYRKPYVNWQSKLRQFINGTARDDWSYRRPNRRSAGSNIVQPSLFSNRPGNITVIVDTSGSVAQAELEQALSEIVSVCKRVKPQEIVVISCDTQVNAVDKYRAGQQITTLQTNGRGGTDMDPAFEYILEQGIRPECIICFTDGEFHWPEKELVRAPVLWAICNPGSNVDWAEHVPYGKYIEVEVTS